MITPSSPTPSVNKNAGDLEIIQRIMNRKFSSPQFTLRNSSCGNDEMMTTEEFPDHPCRNGRCCRMTKLDKSFRSGDEYRLSSADYSSFERSLSPVAVKDLRVSQMVPPPGHCPEQVDKLRGCGRLGGCPISGSEDKFDEENMPVPMASLRVPLRYEFHRRSKSVAHPNYTLGQEARPDDIVCEATDKSARFAPSLLRRFDAAFVKRKGDKWCYAMLIDANMMETEPNNWSLTFVVDEEGSTKTIFLKKWSKYVRMIREPIELNAWKTRKSH
ncbi:hypothetical protein ACHAXS_001333 [Conticribra weissflogii]